MKQKKRKADRRLDVPAWREYLSDPSVVPTCREDCPCTKKRCERHGKCGECYRHHAAGRLLPFCLRQA